MTRAISAALVAVLLAGPAGAQTAYVTDVLLLGLHAASDTSDRAFDNLTSGTELEVLERTRSYARVRTADGREGWVKAAYLVEEKPARARVAELEAEVERLRTGMAQAEAARERAEREAQHAGAGILADRKAAQQLRASLERVERDKAALEARLEQYRSSLPLPWVAGALILSLIGGFVGGWYSLDALIRRRHGGFRVY